MSDGINSMNEGFIVSAVLRGLVAQLTPEQKSGVVNEVKQVLANIQSSDRTQSQLEWAHNLAEHIVQAGITTPKG